MTEMQKQFEKWAVKEDFDTDYGSHKESEYDSIFTQIAWESWQASRAAVVVKLPDWDCYDTPRQAVEACEDRLKDAGVSYE